MNLPSKNWFAIWIFEMFKLVAVGVLTMPNPVSASIIASDNFDGYTSYKTLAAQGSPGNGWYAGWVDNPGATLNVYVTNSLGTGDMDYTPAGGTLIPGGSNSVDTATGGGTGMPIVARQLFTPQTGTFYAACAMRFQVGNVNTGDLFGFCLNSDPASLAYGVQVGYYGDPGGSPNNSLLYLQNGVAPMLSSPSSSRNGVHYLVVKVEKTGTGNYNKVTLWADPGATDETTQPNGDVQLTNDLGIASINQISFFGQNLDSGDRCRFDSLALATTFADLMAPAGPGPAGAAPVNTIRVETAADGSANAVLPAQNLPLLNNTLTCYAIARNASGVFLSNTPASWFLTNITGSVVAGDLAPSADGKSAVLTSHMAGSAKILAVGSATNLVTSGVITVPAGIDQFDALRLYWWTNLMAGSPSPSTVASTAQGYWNTMNTNAGRTTLWSGIPYGSPNSYNIVSTFIRLSAMAQAWAMPDCSLQGNTNLAAAVASGMDWMVANVYTTTATEYGNWFHWEDSGPQNFESAIVFLYPALTSTEINNYCAAIDHFNPSGWMTGANTADKIQIMAIRGILGKNASKMVTARDETSTLFPFVTNGDGFYTDGSFLFHTVAVGSSYGAGFAYTGGYGVDLLSKIPTIVNLLQPSQWQITDPALTNVLFWVTAGDEPLLYNGNMMDMVRGRNIAVNVETESSVGGEVLTAIQQIAAFAPPAIGAAFANFVNSPRLTSGQFHFANMDRVVAQRGNFAFGISMSSTRVAIYESINNENLHGWFTGDGMTYLYVGNGETQFSGDFWPSVDPYFLPGTTVETTVLTNAAGGFHQTTDQNWVGGAQVAGTYGVAGMSLHPNCTNTTLYAKKSWFMLDNEIVCLGAGITCGDPAGVHTTAENRRLGSPITQSFTLNGKAITPTVGWSSNLPSATPSWCALSGTGGYYFPAGQTNLQATFVTNSGAWSDIDQYTGPPTTVYTDNYLRLWYNHGTNPTNANYSYVILPNMTATSVSNYALNPDIIIVSNTPVVQAVKNSALGVVAANFWTSGTNSADIITVNNKASVITFSNFNTYSVGVSDPTQTNTKPISVTLNFPALSLISADPGVTVQQLSPKIILSVNVNGADGQSFQVSFGIAANNSPTISSLADVTVNQDVPTNLVFTISDAQTPASALSVTGFAANPALVNLVFGGSNSNRNVTLTPAFTQTGATTIAIVVSDGTFSTTNSFNYTVLAGPDTDGDGMADGTEVLLGRNPNSAADLGFEFNTDGNFDGWGAFTHITNQIVSGGSLSGTSTNGDPYFSRSGFNFSGNAVSNIVVKIMLPSPNTVQFYWGIAGANVFSAARVLNEAYTATNAWQLVTFPLAALTNWQGQTVTSLRIDPGTVANQTFAIDWVRAMGSDPNVLNVSSAKITSGIFSMSINGQAGLTYVVQTSTNLTTWLPVWTNNLPTPPFLFAETNVTANFSRRFYRVVLAP